MWYGNASSSVNDTCCRVDWFVGSNSEPLCALGVSCCQQYRVIWDCSISRVNPAMGLLPDTQNCGLHMRRECWERLLRPRLQWKPLVGDPDVHRGTCVTHVPRCMSGSLTRGGGENVPGIPGACATRHFGYLVRGQCLMVIWLFSSRYSIGRLPSESCSKERRRDISRVIVGHFEWHHLINRKLRVIINYDDVIKWKHFTRYWPFVRGIHRSPVNSLTQSPSDAELWCFLWSAPEWTIG